MDRQPKRAVSFLKTRAVEGPYRYCHALLKFPQHILVAENPLVEDREVDEAFVAFFNESYRLECSSPTGDILLGKMCHYFPEVRKHGGHFLLNSHRAFQTENQLTSPSVSLPKKPTTEVQKTCGQQHGRDVLCLVRECP